MAFILKDLPYAHNALAPHISEETMQFHHDKHVLAYVNNTNNLIAGTEFEGMALVDIIKKSSGPTFNNAAQIYNHELFWECLSANSGGTPTGKVLEALNANFGSFEEFKSQFTQKATTQFGAGWAWLSKTADGKLVVSSTSNGDNPLTVGNTPILGLDVWEHAYYIDYRNARPNYISAFWEIVNWDFVSNNL